MTEGAPLVDVRSLSRSFGSLRAVDDLSFQLQRGVVWGFIGPNGAGKTTTMRILATLDVPDVGDASVAGVSVLEKPREVRRKVGFMSDQFPPYPNLPVSAYLDFFARAYGLRGMARRRTVSAVVGFCGLGDFRDRPTTGLSKGMGQRVHLAKTLLHDPELLILDEPASGLDPRARVEFRELVRGLADAGKTILISSHILSELSETCDGVLVIERGRKVVDGTIAEVSRGLSEHRFVHVRALRGVERAREFFILQPLVHDLREDGAEVAFEFQGDDEALAQLLQRAVAAELGVVEFRVAETDLEDIFMHATQGRLQ